jgi:hypothetical protein
VAEPQPFSPALDDRVHQHDEAGRAGHRPGDVVAPVTEVGAALRDQERRDRDRGDADRHVDEEDPLPAETAREEPAEQHAEGRARAGDRAEDPERLVPFGALFEDHCDQRERRRGGERGAETLHAAEHDQRALAPREPAEQRPDREEAETGHEDQPAADKVGDPSAQEQEAAEEERVGAHHPLQVRLREVQRGLDRGQRHVHDRDVEDDHELRRADQCEGVPAAGGSGCHAVSFTVVRSERRPAQTQAGVAEAGQFGREVEAERPEHQRVNRG